MADLMSWEAHEKLRQDLMAALLRTPPPGYSRVTKQQIRRADEQAFAIMAKETEGGIKRKGGTRPLDDAVDKALNHRDYNLPLQPLAGSGGSGAASSGEKRTTSNHDDELARLRKKVKDQTEQLRGGGQGNGKGNGRKGQEGLEVRRERSPPK